jgi:hypothetical protein
LGSWGYPPDVDFWDLLAKISPSYLPSSLENLIFDLNLMFNEKIIQYAITVTL